MSTPKGMAFKVAMRGVGTVTPPAAKADDPPTVREDEEPTGEPSDG